MTMDMDLTKILKVPGEKCKPGFHKMPDGSCMSDEEMKKKAERVQKGKEGVFNGNAYVDADGNPWGIEEKTKGERVLAAGSGRPAPTETDAELFTMSWASGGPLVVKAYHKKKRRMY